MPVDRGALYSGLGGDALDRRAGGSERAVELDGRLSDPAACLELTLGSAALLVSALWSRSVFVVHTCLANIDTPLGVR